MQPDGLAIGQAKTISWCSCPPGLQDPNKEGGAEGFALSGGRRVRAAWCACPCRSRGEQCPHRQPGVFPFPSIWLLHRPWWLIFLAFILQVGILEVSSKEEPAAGANDDVVVNVAGLPRRLVPL